MMKGTLVRIIVLLGLALVPRARAEQPEIPLRSFDRFEFDPTTASGAWIELGSAFSHDVQRDGALQLSTSVATGFGRFAYGADYFEGGLLVPYRNIEVDLDGIGPTIASEEDGFGDLQLYGKAVPLRTEFLDAGLGLELTLPTGDEDKNLGTGELGMLPFGTVGLHLGPLDIRGHGGYLFTSRDNTATAFESTVYGGGIFYAVNEQFALRSEINGQTVSVPGPNIDVISWEPGVDFRFPLGSFDLLVRPTAAVGMTDESPDWGVGGSFVATWNPGAP